jgi:glycine/D-amino acid oxidase-like deaminating enzyme
MQTADAVVIGAGINGAATAYNLVKRGLKNVVLLEKQLIASGGTGRSAAIIRQHYSNEELVRLVKRSVDIFHNFDDEVGGDPGFVNCGWAFLIPESVSDGFSKNIAMGQRLGVDVREIARQDLLEMEPRIDLSDVHRIAYEPGSGYADPRTATHAYVERFVDLGGRLLQLTGVQGLMVEDSAVRGVKTDAGDISTDVVVDAAGPWADRIAAWAGVDLPIEITREEEIIFETASVGGPPKLCFSDMAKAIYYRPEGASRMLVGRGFPKDYAYVEPDGYDQEVEVSFIAEATERLHARWPTFSRALALNSYTGLYDVTPDWHPVLGRADGVDGFYLCAGFSGHGFKIAPAIGEVMAEEIIDGAAHSIDIKRLNLRRFAAGALIGAAYGTNRA